MKKILTLVMLICSVAGYAENGKPVICRDKKAVKLSWNANVQEGYFVVERQNKNGVWKPVAVVLPGEGQRGYFFKDNHQKKNISYRISHVQPNETTVFAESLQPAGNVSGMKIHREDKKLIVGITKGKPSPTQAEFFSADGTLLYSSVAMLQSGKMVIEIPEALSGRLILRVTDSTGKAEIKNLML